MSANDDNLDSLILEALDQRRHDVEFMARLRTRLEEDFEVLDRLAKSPPPEPRLTEAPKPFAIGSDTWPGVGKLLEEMGELGQVLGKMIGCGGLDHWDGNLADGLMEELADVQAAAMFVSLMCLGPVERDVVGRRATKKLQTFRRWHEEQRAR